MRDIVLKKNKLFKESIELNNLSKDEGEKGFEIKKMQDEVYKKYKFYDEFLKANNKNRK